MENIFDYAEKYCNIDFDEFSYNKLDALIFSQLAYIEYEKIFDFNSPLKLIDIWRIITETFSEEELLQFSLIMQKAILLLCIISNGKRYRNIVAKDYRNEVFDAEEKQFSAITLELQNGENVIAFRGTDETLSGLKESAALSFTFPIYSQIQAIKYLNEHFISDNKYYHLTGHSKGGNLSVYSVVECDDSLKDRIIDIFNFDGPGFSSEYVKSKPYDLINEKITTIIPEGSIIGRIFNHDEKILVVESEEHGISQHHIYNWHINDNDFEYSTEANYSSILFEKTINDVLENAEKEKIESVFETLFEILDATEAKTMNEIKELKPEKLFEVLKVLDNKDAENQKYVIEILTLMVKFGIINIMPEIKYDFSEFLDYIKSGKKINNQKIQENLKLTNPKNIDKNIVKLS